MSESTISTLPPEGEPEEDHGVQVALPTPFMDGIVQRVLPFHCLKDPAAELPALMRTFGEIQVKGTRRFLEIGTWQGGTSAAMKLAFPEDEIWTLDLPDPSKSRFNPQPKQQTGRAHRELGVEGIKQLWMDSAGLVDFEGVHTFDLVFVDGDHSEEGCLRDLMLSYKLLTPNGLLVAHDYTEGGVDPDPRPHWTVWVENACNKFVAKTGFRKERLPGWLVALHQPGGDQ